MGTMRREYGETAPLLGTPEVLEMEYLSVYRGSVRETWRAGFYTEDFQRHVMEGSGNGKFLSQGSIRGT